MAPRGGADAYCPHCQLLVARSVAPHWPRRPEQCPHCRLLIGASRSLSEPADEPGARGTAAGVFAQEARRGNNSSPASTAQVREAILAVATELGTRPERLLMVDYQQRTAGDESMPSLTAVFDAYGSWKRARRAAVAT